MTDRRVGGLDVQVDVVPIPARRVGGTAVLADIAAIPARRVGTVAVQVDYIQGTATRTVTATQAQALTLQVCVSNPYANLETMTYGQLEAFTYGQLELQCRTIYGRSVGTQQPTSPTLVKQGALARTIAQAQSVALRRAISLRTLTIQQATSVALVSRAVQTLTLATTQATALVVRQAVSLLRSIAQTEQVTLQTGGGAIYRLTVSTTQPQHATLIVALPALTGKVFTVCARQLEYAVAGRSMRFQTCARQTIYPTTRRSTRFDVGSRRIRFTVEVR